MYTGCPSVFGFVGRTSVRHGRAWARSETENPNAKGITNENDRN